MSNSVLLGFLLLFSIFFDCGLGLKINPTSAAVIDSDRSSSTDAQLTPIFGIAFVPMMITIPEADGYYTSYNLTNLTVEQKEVDAFIRQNAEIPQAANLTSAQGNNRNQFEYRYSQNSDKGNITSIITVLKTESKDNAGKTTEGKSESQYVIISKMRLESRPMNQQDKQQMQKDLKRMQRIEDNLLSNQFWPFDH